MAGHTFEVLSIDPPHGTVTVRWDADEELIVTCRIPIGPEGDLLGLDEFKENITRQCHPLLSYHDKIAGKSFKELKKYIGQKFDVTKEFLLMNK